MNKLVEHVARTLILARGAAAVASEKQWPRIVADYEEMCAKYPGLENDYSLINDAVRDARTCIKATIEHLQANITPGMARAGEGVRRPGTLGDGSPCEYLERFRQPQDAFASMLSQALLEMQMDPKAKATADRSKARAEIAAILGTIPGADMLPMIDDCGGGV